MKARYPYTYDPKRRRLAGIYTKGRMISGILNGIGVPIVFYLAVYYSGFSLWIKQAAAGFGLLAVLVYGFVFLSMLALAQLPLRFYTGFVYEHKYGLSRHSVAGWTKDHLKSLLLMYLFTLPLIYGLYLILPLQHWWVYAAGAYFLLSVFLYTILPVFILPLFYKLKPYRNRAHLKKLMEMLKAAGLGGISGVYVANESSKSVKANALFSGLGNTKRIVLFDTLLRNFTKDEVETVIAHEAGHYVNKDIWRGVVLDTLLVFPVLFLISAFVKDLTDVASLPLIFLVYTLAGLLLTPLSNTYSRHREAQADLFALNACGKPEAQESSEKRLADISLGNHDPHPLVEFFFHSHPSTEKRVRMCREWKRAFLFRKKGNRLKKKKK